MSYKSIIIVLLLFCVSCSTSEYSSIRKKNAKIEYIKRKADDSFYTLSIPKKRALAPYPFEEGKLENISKITKEFFRCKGISLNPKKIDQAQNEYSDCDSHSLPIIDKKEDIYPVLIDILNFIQRKTKKKVVITCGHRCPIHNIYADDSKESQNSKHMIGAEVDFYVQGLEDRPMEVVNLIFDFYQEKKIYKGHKDYENFQFYEKETDVLIKPWYNKELFIKLYQKEEGRDFDNRHPYPYICVQLRYDKISKQRVTYSWEKAYRGYLRW